MTIAFRYYTNHNSIIHLTVSYGSKTHSRWFNTLSFVDGNFLTNNSLLEQKNSRKIALIKKTLLDQKKQNNDKDISVIMLGGVHQQRQVFVRQHILFIPINFNVRKRVCVNKTHWHSLHIFALIRFSPRDTHMTIQ